MQVKKFKHLKFQNQSIRTLMPKDNLRSCPNIIKGITFYRRYMKFKNGYTISVITGTNICMNKYRIKKYEVGILNKKGELIGEPIRNLGIRDVNKIMKEVQQKNKHGKI